MSTAIWSSPRPATSKLSPLLVSPTRIETFPSASRVRQELTAVTEEPSARHDEAQDLTVAADLRLFEAAPAAGQLLHHDARVGLGDLGDHLFDGLATAAIDLPGDDLRP